MCAEHARRGAVLRHLGERCEQRLFGGGDERGLVRGDAALEQRPARTTVAVRIRGEEVDTGEPVHLQVDEPGRRDAFAVRGAQPDRCDAAVGKLDVAGDKGPVDQRCPDAESHR